MQLLGMQAHLGDKGNEGKGEPSPLEPRVGRSGGGCREMQLGNAELGDEGDEGKVQRASHHRWGRVWERRWGGVER
jgi:hypothetical protein